MYMAPFQIFVALAFALLASSMAHAEVHEHVFTVGNLTANKLCQEQVVSAVNGRTPGPLLRIREGDGLVIHVVNKSPYNVTIHWHGIFQYLTPWADGPEYVTQCPMRPGQSYTYKFKVTNQEGTLWWHAHSNWLRGTVYGGLIIRPRKGRSYPFPKPHKEFPILLGEWFNTSVIAVENQALATGGGPNNSVAYLINGEPGDLYPCSKSTTQKFQVIQGKTYMLRIVNAALNNQLFFKVAGHNMTVVAVDAAYTNPYCTDVVLLGPGQTTDVLITADQPVGTYYMAASPYSSAAALSFDNTTTTAVLAYQGSTSLTTPLMPVLPAANDTATAHKFNSNLTGLVTSPFWEPVPLEPDYRYFMTVGLGLVPCGGNNATCAGPLGERLAASVTNKSFVFPTKASLLEAHYYGINGIYNTNFPKVPRMPFDYTNANNSLNTSVVMTDKSTTIVPLKYNSTIEIVFQDTALVGAENHPMHIHGHNFFVLAQGFGNFDPEKDLQKFNLVNPQERNTIGVPVGGWAVIRFRTHNPGMWLMHCHLDIHLSWGLATVFRVGNGGTPSSTLPPPPSDLPKC